MSDTVSIMMCGNSAVFDGILLCMLSLVKHTSRPVHLYIGTMDLTDLDLRYTPLGEREREVIERVLQSKNARSRAELIDLGDYFRRELIDSKNLKTAYTPYAMIRLFADEVDALPDKLIYLDTDVMLLGDIGEYFDIDVDGCYLAGTLDYYGHVFISPKYLNSGVMLWNLALIRRDGVFRRATKLCRERRMLLMDQSAINKYTRGRVVILPRRYNEQHGKRDDTLIQHFSKRIRWFPFGTVNIKPWHRDKVRSVYGLDCYDDIYEQFDRIKESYHNA